MIDADDFDCSLSFATVGKYSSFKEFFWKTNQILNDLQSKVGIIIRIIYINQFIDRKSLKRGWWITF